MRWEDVWSLREPWKLLGTFSERLGASGNHWETVVGPPRTCLPVCQSAAVYASTSRACWSILVYWSAGLPGSTGLPVCLSTSLSVYQSTGLPVYCSGWILASGASWVWILASQESKEKQKAEANRHQ